MQIHVDDPTHYQHDSFKPYRVMALCLKALRELYPDYQIWRDFHYEYEKNRLAIDIINGSSELRQWVDDRSAGVDDLEKLLVADEKAWQSERAPFLLY